MYILLNLGIAKLFVFINGSLGNLKDFISQIRYIIILVNKFKRKNKFIIKGNLINTSSIKYKYITWSNLVSKICRIINNLDLIYITAVILKIIIDQQNLSENPDCFLYRLKVFIRIYYKIRDNERKVSNN
jgi:hypothetical protein